MEKNKLGIVINTTKANNRTSGFRAIYRFNDDEWSSVVRDTGAELKKVTNNSASVPIHFIQFESNGCFYCIMQPIAEMIIRVHGFSSIKTFFFPRESCLQ